MWSALSLPPAAGAVALRARRAGSTPCRLSCARKPRTVPLNWFVPRLVTKLRPTPPVCTFRSLPPVVTAISSNASKSKYIELRAARRRVGDDHAVERPHRVGRRGALADEDRLLAALVAGDVDAVDDDAGHGLQHAHGSRPAERPISSSLVSVVDVPSFLVSTTGVSAVTVIVSWTRRHLHLERDVDVHAGVDDDVALDGARSQAATPSACRCPLSRFRKRNSPCDSVIVAARRAADRWWRRRVTSAPGSTAPDSSVTVP